MELLIILLICFVFFPLFKFFFTIGKTAHTFKKAYDQQAEQYKKAQEQHSQESKKSSRKERARAYFKDSGEDVEFEEIKTERNVKPTVSSETSSKESQITDAQYEDVK